MRSLGSGGPKSKHLVLIPGGVGVVRPKKTEEWTEENSSPLNCLNPSSPEPADGVTKNKDAKKHGAVRAGPAKQPARTFGTEARTLFLQGSGPQTPVIKKEER